MYKYVFFCIITKNNIKKKKKRKIINCITLWPVDKFYKYELHAFNSNFWLRYIQK